MSTRLLPVAVAILALLASAGAALWLVAPGDEQVSPAVDGGFADVAAAPARPRAAPDAREHGDAERPTRRDVPALVGRVLRGAPAVPVGEATVVVTGLAGDEFRTMVSTDARGDFEVSFAPGGTPLRVVVSAHGCAEFVMDDVRVTPGAVCDLGDLRLIAPGTLDVSVRDEAGSPVAAQAALMASDGARTRRGWVIEPLSEFRPVVLKDAPNGRCTLHGAPRDSVLVVTARGFASVRRAIRLGDGERRSADIVMRRSATLRGRVVSASGTPVPGVRVRVDAGAFGALDGLEEARTDADGRFTLDGVPLGPTRIECIIDDAFLWTADAIRMPDADGLTIELPATAAIDGIVVDAETGSPVSGATVRVRRCAARTTGSDGAFRLPCVPVGDVTLVCEAPGYAPRALAPGDPGYPVIGEGRTARARLEMLRGATLEGRVVGPAPSGAEVPIVGAMVTVEGWNGTEARVFRRTRTDAVGSFRVAGLPQGMARVAIDAPGLAMEPAATGAAPLEGDSSPNAHRLDVPKSGSFRATFRMTAGVTLSGVVVDAEGTPVPGALVAAGERFIVPLTTLSGADGRFRIEAVPALDECGVSCTAAGGLTARTRVATNVARAADDLRLVVSREMVRIEGSVRLRWTDPPPAGVGVTIHATEIGGGRGAGVAAEVGPDGAFAAVVCAEGRRVTVIATAPGHLPAEWVSPEWVAPESDEPPSVLRPELRLVPAGSVRGLVVDENDVPVAGATVLAGVDWKEPADSSAVVAVTDGKGRFVAREIEAPYPEIVIAAPGYEVTRLEVGRARKAEHRIVLARELSIGGRVTSAETGLPLAGVAIARFVGGRPRSAECRTDSEGRWRIRGVKRGTHVVLAGVRYVRGQPNVVEESVVVDAGGKDVDFALRSGVALAGRVVLEDGTPPRSPATVRVIDADGDEVPGEADVDVEGRFEVLGLSPGTVSLEAELPWSGDLGLMSDPAHGIECGRRDVVLTLRRGVTIRARFVDEDGAPVPIDLSVAEVRIEEGGRFASAGQAQAGPEPSVVLRTGLRRDTAHTIYVSGVPGHLDARLADVRTATAERDVDVRVTLVRRRQITGRVLDRDGQGVPSVMVAAVALGPDIDREAPGTRDRTVTGADGTFCLDELGSYEFEVGLERAFTADDRRRLPVHRPGDFVEILTGR